MSATASLSGPAARGVRSDIGPAVRAGLLASVLLFGVLGAWAALTAIGGAVIASGQVVVHGKQRPVQSLEGGMVRETVVKNGDTVVAGQVLLRLDRVLVQTSLDIARQRLADGLAQKARLESELAGLSAPRFDYAAMPFPLPDMSAEEAVQTRIFAARAEVLRGERDRLVESLAQFDAQTSGVDGQIAAKHDEITLMEQELAKQQSLTDKGLARQSDLSAMRRDHATLQGEMAALEAERIRLSNARRDAELQTRQGERNFREGVVSDLRAAATVIEEQTLEIVNRLAEIERLEIRAPVAGIVHEIQVAPGGVIAPGATILEVVPLAEGMEFEVSVDPRAVDQVHPGQKAEVVFSAFDPRSTPRLKGEVVSVSPDTVTDPRSGRSFYRVGLAVPPEELARLGAAQLMPGMPVEAYLATGERSVLSYLLHPLVQQLALAFREE